MWGQFWYDMASHLTPMNLRTEPVDALLEQHMMAFEMVAFDAPLKQAT
jgi:hypothetical protein